MFDHVTIRVSDGEASAGFYGTVLRTLGIERTAGGSDFVEWDDFSLVEAGEGEAVTRGLHVGFVAPSRAHVDEFWRAGTAAGHRSDGVPGPRPQYGHDYYGGFLLDPDGSSVEAVHHGALRRCGGIDHLWIRVRDVAASRRFYELVAAHAGFRLNPRGPDRAQSVGESGSFSLVAGGTRTEGVHVAFPARANATVEAFHYAAVGAGYRDNGPPGERPEYHAGYYAAYVLDPDGHNVELVHHGRP